MSVESIVERLTEAGYRNLTVDRNGNNTGSVVKVGKGPVVNVYDSGTVNVQGKAAEKETLEEVLAPVLSAGIADTSSPVSRTIFVVYGHDGRARNDLEAMLRRWDLEPLILEQLPSEGQTIIEKLEKYTNEDVSYAVVLATPDDLGHKKDKPDEAKLRARQNVVLELGLVLAKLGRDRVAILKPRTTDPFEDPSDIDGLIYIPYVDSVDDVRVQLAKEMNNKGITVDLGRL